jgi:hypothetical protein
MALGSRALFVLTVASAAAAPALAGPARYDKETRSFRFTYTFVDLPSSGARGFTAEGTALGATVRKPAPEEENQVRLLIGAVSEVMEQATEGRGKISSLDFVDTIKDADVVISMTGQPDSPGYAARPGFGRPGQIALYYQSLLPKIRQDVVNTAVHEVFHYVFGLEDEYDHSKFPGGCPAPGGKPGCLMDNYLTGARGYMGRLCQQGEHNAQPAQRSSCQDIVDAFFKAQGVEKSAAARPGEPPAQPFAPDPRKTVVQSALGKVRARVAERERSSTAGLSSFARSTLLDLIASFNREGGEKIEMSSREISEAVRLITKAGTIVPPERAVAAVSPAVLQQIEGRARQIGQRLAADGGRRRPDDRFRVIRTELRRFVTELVRKGQIDEDAFGRAPQEALVESLARRESGDPEIQSLDRIARTGAAGLELTRQMAGWIVQMLDEQGAPGTRANLAFLRAFDERNRELMVPGREMSRFGRRRSRFILPAPMDDNYQIVVTQGGVFPYNTLRDRGFQDFSFLINRERIVLDTPQFAAASDPAARRLGPTIERPLAALSAPTQEERRDTNIRVADLLNTIVEQIERDRLENITVLVPPDGLPAGITDALQAFENRFAHAYDLRLDLVLVGSPFIQPALRHQSVRSRGSILTITDIDEIPTIAQRLRDEQTDGSWLVIPQQGTMPRGARQPTRPDQAADDLDTLRRWATEDLALVLPRLDVAEQEIRLRLEPQTIDEERRVDEAVNLTRSLRDVLIRLDERLQSEDAGQHVLGDRRRAGFQIVNLDYMKLIAEARATVEEGTTAIRRILDNPARDPISETLLAVAQELVSDEALGPGLRLPASLVRLHEKAYGAALVLTGDTMPIYSRIDRRVLDRARRGVEAASIGPGAVALEEIEKSDERLIRLARFHTEGGAGVELVIGLSRPLPNIVDPVTGSWGPQEVKDALKLYNDAGAVVDDGTMMRYNPGKSSPTMLVYTAEGRNRTLPEGWYTPFFELNDATLRLLKGVPRGDHPSLQSDEINFTFSVASERPNVRLDARLVEDLDDTELGTVRGSEGYAVVEVQVLARSPVRYAKVIGFWQKIALGTVREPITPRLVMFHDTGSGAGSDRPESRDRVADDGIYTAAIPLADFQDVREGAEIRLFIQAEATDESRYRELESLPLVGSEEEGTPAPERTASTARASSFREIRREETAKAVAATERALQEQREKDTEIAQGKVPKFTRATSLHFRVEP